MTDEEFPSIIQLLKIYQNGLLSEKGKELMLSRLFEDSDKPNNNKNAKKWKRNNVC